ncbi:phosphoadenosine phosphosulfate reductase family protein [Streptacidiphilus monticola]
MARTARRHVVMWSGGITSWAVAHLVAQRYGTENLTLLFADTRYEDEDLYRWNREASVQIGVPLTVVADGRTPWQVFRDKRYIGNTRIAPCSQLLKQAPCRDWLIEHTDPAHTTVYVGIDWTETHRVPAIVRNYQPWTAEAPLTEPRIGTRRSGWPKPARWGWPRRGCTNSVGSTTTAEAAASRAARPSGRTCSRSSPTATPKWKPKRTTCAAPSGPMSRSCGTAAAAPPNRSR